MRLLLMSALSLALTACEPSSRNGDASHDSAVVVIDPVIHLPAVRGRPGAAYFRLNAPQDRIALTGVSSPSVQKIEMHASETVNGVAAMRPIQRQLVRHQDIWFTHGGRHLMLFGMDPKLTAGDRTTLTFMFERGEPVTVQAEVQGPGGDAH